jgi:hypothetical protein
MPPITAFAPCPNSSVHAPISVCNTPLHDHGIRAHLPDHQRLERFSLEQTGLSRSFIWLRFLLDMTDVTGLYIGKTHIIYINYK